MCRAAARVGTRSAVQPLQHLADPRATVLLLDDEQLVRKVFARTLRAAGYRVVEVVTPAEALDALASMPVGVVLTDLSLPGVRGCDVLKQLRSSGVPMIAISGYMDPRMADEARACGAFDCLAKPLSSASLLESVERASMMPPVWNAPD
jgi:DNA-binding NtrC family response regulator